MNIDVAFMLNAHIGLFFALIGVTVLALIVTLRSLLRSGVGLLNRIFMMLYRIVLILQWLAGVVLLIMLLPDSSGPTLGYRLEHALTMTVAVIVTHLFGGRRGSRPLASLIVILVASALVAVGYLRLLEARDALSTVA